MAEVIKSQNKTLEFTLLQKRPIYLRVDSIVCPIIAFAYFYVFGDHIYNYEHIFASVMMIVTGSLVFLILLLNHWSVDAHKFMAYNTL